MCGISSLGIDHTSILGDSLEKIAWQKGGIFKVGMFCLGYSVFIDVFWGVADGWWHR